MKKFLWIAYTALSCYIGMAQNAQPQVIPSLQKWEGGEGFFSFSKKTNLVISHSSLQKGVEQFANDITSEYGYSNRLTSKKKNRNEIRFSLTEKKLPNEGYIIDIQSDKIDVTANTPQGVFWATRTLLQMLHNAGTQLPVGKIQDYPNYSHRGFMLDVGRKFFSLEYLQNYIKLLSYYKMNEFQIHLNDNGFHVFFDNDWDKTYAAFRLESTTFPGLAAKDGHYTKDQFRQLQKMGMDYGVNVIPEIDVPAHSLAFTHYKPEIGSDTYGRDHLDLYNPETYAFVDALYAEYILGDNPTFIGPDLHIGTDEYDKRESEKYREFTDRYLKYIQKLGKNVRMWGGLRWLKGKTPVTSENVIVNAWSKDWVDPFASIQEGYKLISTCDAWLYIVPSAGYYRDFLDEKWLYEQWIPEKINPDETIPENSQALLGGMFAVWNDHVGNGTSQQDVHYRTLPALKVLAQKMWNRNPLIPFDEYKKIADNLHEAPQVNMLGRVKHNQSKVLWYAMNSSKEKDLWNMGYDEISRQNITINKTEKSLIFGSKSLLQTPITDIGYDYKITFDLNLFDQTQDQAVLFESSNSKVFVNKKENTYTIGFARDGYTYHFDIPVPSQVWNRIQFEGNYQNITLKVGEKTQTLAPVKQEFKKENGKIAHMYYQQTLVFPLKNIGSSVHSFQGMMKNLKVEKL